MYFSIILSHSHHSDGLEKSQYTRKLFYATHRQDTTPTPGPKGVERISNSMCRGILSKHQGHPGRTLDMGVTLRCLLRIPPQNLNQCRVSHGKRENSSVYVLSLSLKSCNNSSLRMPISSPNTTIVLLTFTVLITLTYDLGD